MSTVSVFRACAGGYVGAGHVHPALLDAVREAVAEAKDDSLVADGYVARCGDDIGLVLLHDEAAGSDSIRTLATDAFERAADVGRRLHQHGLNGHPLDVDGAEISFTVRESEPVLCFFADKAGPGAWNVHLYRMFGDPFNTPALVSDSATSQGFRFYSNGVSSGWFDLPDDLYRFLGVAGQTGSCVREVLSRATEECGAVSSGGRDPVLIVRCGSPFPSVEEVLEAFAVPYALGASPGGPRPLVPVSANGDASTRSLGPSVSVSKWRPIGWSDRAIS
jgi:fructose 1,6-bisphosphate aldolase/phosphatase